MKTNVKIAVVVIVFVFCWASYGFGYHYGYGDAKHKYCQHGESSISATKVNGKFVQTKPVRTGC